MKLILPLGKEKMVSAADFDIEPHYGCACSNVNNEYLTDRARIKPEQGVPFPSNCMCLCAYGNENQVANYELGFNSNEW